MEGWPAILIFTMEYVLAITIVPRFIMNLRELYARDVQGRRGSDVDTAFGLTSTADRGAFASAIALVDGGRNEGIEENQGIEMEEREVRDVGSSA